jgi:WD40 repeat protein
MWSTKAVGGGIWSLAFSPADDAIAVGGGFDPPLQVFPLSNEGPLAGKNLVGHKAGSTVCGVSFSPDGRLLASGSSDGSVIFWNVSDGSIARRVPYVNSPQVDVVAFSPSGSILASAGGFDLHLKLWPVP